MNTADSVSRLNSALEGRYQIERELGEGGMATVYLAQDLKHERQVAVKVLKPELAAVVGAERFLGEIKTTANLQHPHILPLFDSGEAGGLLFYVMPYVEGESLRDRLDREHQLPVDEAVRIATNMAEALDYAHRQGVIHRDVKPANVLLLDGKPVISDFGIALAVGAAGGGRLTETGLSLGTPHYMSPEQATGDLNVGPATDIYALGCVLYEMLVGEPPFTGSTPQAVLGKIIIGAVPSARAERASVPSHVDAVIMTALRKVPADRFVTPGRFGESLGDEGFRDSAASPRAREVSAARLWQATTVILLVAVMGLWASRGTEVPAAPARFSVPLPGGRDAGAEFFAYAISPDGRYVAVNGVMGEEDGVWVRALTERAWRHLPGTEVSAGVLWSPDSRSIAFFQSRSLKAVDVEDGEVSQIAELSEGNHFGSSGSWGSSEFIVFRQPSGRDLWLVSASGGTPRRLMEAADDEVLRFPHFLPDGERFLFTKRDGDHPGIYVGTLSEPAGRLLLPDQSSATFVASEGGSPAHILFARDGRLMAQPVNETGLESLGRAFEVHERALTQDNGRLAISAAQGGLVVFLTGSSRALDSQFAWIDSVGRVLAFEGEPGPSSAASVSPNGLQMAVLRSGATDRDVWLRDLERGVEAPHTFDVPISSWSNMVWSPDGERLAFAVAQAGADGRANFYLQTSSQSVARSNTTLLEGPNRLLPTDWTDDGQMIYTEHASEGGSDLWYTSVDGDSTVGRPTPIRRDEFNTNSGRVSPDGRWLAYVSDESGQPQIWVQAFPEARGRWQVSTGDGPASQPQWSTDGRSLYYVTDRASSLMVASVNVATAPDQLPIEQVRLLLKIRLNATEPSFSAVYYVPTPDGRFLVNGLLEYSEPSLEVLQQWVTITNPQSN